MQPKNESNEEYKARFEARFNELMEAISNDSVDYRCRTRRFKNLYWRAVYKCDGGVLMTTFSRN